MHLPERYRASEGPDELVSLWRGDIAGRESQGFKCYLNDRSIDPEQVVYDSLFVQYPNIKTLVKRHTHSNHNSPFVSLTDSFELAREFSAGAIYRVLVAADRLVIDPPTTSESAHIEALAVGAIVPEEIVETLQ